MIVFRHSQRVERETSLQNDTLKRNLKRWLRESSTFFTPHFSRWIVVLKVESYRQTFTNNNQKRVDRGKRSRRADTAPHVDRENVTKH